MKCQLGPITLRHPVVLAPMAGITDRPYRDIARRFGCEYAVGEMLSAKRELHDTRKSNQRSLSADETGPRIVQLVGTDPAELAAAAQHNAAQGADVIDINMGCPAKKVYKVAAGSALMADPARVEAIVSRVVDAVDLPVSVKIRTGLHQQWRNGVEIARIIERAGAAWISVHGRTRACGFKGEAEFKTVGEIVNSVSIPVIANGDIDTPQRAQAVLESTGASAVMIGRATQGAPWLFNDVLNHFGQRGVVISNEVKCATMIDHIAGIHAHYGAQLGPRIARKHIAWYLNRLGDARQARAAINTIDDGAEQIAALEAWFWRIARGTIAQSVA